MAGTRIKKKKKKLTKWRVIQSTSLKTTLFLQCFFNKKNRNTQQKIFFLVPAIASTI